MGRRRCKGDCGKKGEETLAACAKWATASFGLRKAGMGQYAVQKNHRKEKKKAAPERFKEGGGAHPL